MESKLKDLKTRLMEVYDLSSTIALLSWDQSTYMPPEGAAARGRQMAALGKIVQQKFIDPEIGKLLDDLRPYEESLPYDSDDASLIRVTRRDYERETKVPPDFLGELYNHSADTFQVWTEARPNNDFAKVRPYLEKTLDLSRKLANFFPGYESIIDPLINMSDYGMKAASIQAIFADLRSHLVPLVKAISSQEEIDDSCLRKNFPAVTQADFGNQVIQRLGYDFNRGRIDKTHHPFTTKFSLGDVRITTRFQENYLGDSLFSTIHEAGHAMYEQGIRMDFEGTPLARGTSSGVHESQSRLWENVVGRSRSFWQFFYPSLQADFQEQLKSVSQETFYRAINKVALSLIRTDADEVTYNLHVMLRFGLEMDLLEGRLEVRDLPEAWNARFEKDFGIRPPDDRNGVLQDVHWYGGSIGGAFQGYTLGNIMSGMFYAAALKAHPEIPAEIEAGCFGTLHDWLKENIYQHGSKFTASELAKRITGGPVRIEPYIQYLKTKYGEIYRL
jgi:carboxypeptidase Taq